MKLIITSHPFINYYDLCWTCKSQSNLSPLKRKNRRKKTKPEIQNENNWRRNQFLDVKLCEDIEENFRGSSKTSEKFIQLINTSELNS